MIGADPSRYAQQTTTKQSVPTTAGSTTDAWIGA